jgi:hypothetical protein
MLALRGVPAAWEALGNTRETLSARSDLLARAEVDVLQADALKDSAAVIRGKVLGLAPRLLSGAREADATADLALRLKRAAADNRVRVERTSALSDSSRGDGLRQVSLRASLEGDSRGTMGVLGALARSGAALTTTDLKITAANPWATGSTAEVLKIEMTVRGWYFPRPEARR